MPGLASPFARPTLVAVALAAAGAVQALPALPAAQAYAQATSTDFAGNACDSGLLVGASSASAGCASVSTGVNAGSLATAGSGSVRITSNADTQSTGLDSHAGNGWSSAGFVDWMAIAGPAGKTGVLTGTLYFSGGLGASANGSANSSTNAGASYNFSASFFGQNVGLSGGVLQATNGTSNSSNPAGGAFTVTAPISFGNDGWAIGAITMTAITQAESAARPYQQTSASPLISADARAAAAFGHTLYWGGITILTVDGVELSGYALTSASGADYRFSTSPVPEPGTVALMLVGLGAISWRKRRSRL
ncbi:PEP-CTERM sorting domain-containing protein [Roseateles sp. NT4]|uniref:PEP-CTERM sorting domain-containing protein n=1 Tax=Roseateles sp. NT4 TaxID=3453715 RepID=UPI003EE8B341